MDPITLAILSFILTFIFAKKGGMSTTGALLSAAGVAGLTYYGADKYQTNSNAPLEVDGDVGADDSSLGDKLSGSIGGIADWIAKNPGLALGGAAGAGVIAGLSKEKLWLIGGAILGAILILK